LKLKKKNPKHGLIYDASLITQSVWDQRGKITRSAKCATSIRIDAFGKSLLPTFGIENRAKVLARLQILENRSVTNAKTPPKCTS